MMSNDNDNDNDNVVDDDDNGFIINFNHRLSFIIYIGTKEATRTGHRFAWADVSSSKMHAEAAVGSSSSSSSVSLNDDDNHDFGAPPSNLALNQPAPIPGARSFVGRVFRFARDMSLPATVECNGGGRSSNGGGGEAERVLDSNSKNKEVSADVALFKGRSLKGSSPRGSHRVPKSPEERPRRTPGATRRAPGGNRGEPKRDA